MRKFLFLILSFCLALPAYSATQWKDEGVSIGYVQKENFVGPGIVVTRAGIEGTLTVDTTITGDARYLKLDTTNDPLTNPLDIRIGDVGFISLSGLTGNVTLSGIGGYVNISGAITDTITITSGSITDTTGEISFGNENLTTTGDFTLTGTLFTPDGTHTLQGIGGTNNESLTIDLETYADKIFISSLTAGTILEYGIHALSGDNSKYYFGTGLDVEMYYQEDFFGPNDYFKTVGNSTDWYISGFGLVSIDSDVKIMADSKKLYFGAADDASIYYDGTDLIIDSAEVGSGAVKTTSGRIVNTTRVTTTYTVLVTDHIVACDTDGGAFTATLPIGVDGQIFIINNCGSAGLALTVDGNGAETINGDLTQTVYDGETIQIYFETTEGWRVM